MYHAIISKSMSVPRAAATIFQPSIFWFSDLRWSLINIRHPGCSSHSESHANSQNKFNRGNNFNKQRKQFQSKVLRNLQNQGSKTAPQMANLTGHAFSKFVTAISFYFRFWNSSSVNCYQPKGRFKKDSMPPANNESTEDVQPPVVQSQSRNPNPEPNVAPEFPSRRNVKHEKH
ncbi:hypothetical protein Tco_0462317 [Tanacetum coccineum]